MEQCHSLKVLSLEDLELDENHCRVLGTYSRPDLEIMLISCTLTNTGASTLVEVLERNQGPTKLECCHIDNRVPANGLRGNSRLNSLKPRLSNNRGVIKRELLAFAGALKENKGLVDLDLSFCLFNGKIYDAVYDSLKTHPTLPVLNLRMAYESPLAPAVLESRVQALVDMLKVSTSMHTIHLHDHYSEHELFGGLVIPYLEANRLRPRVRATQRTLPIPYRAKVLGRALLAVRTSPNRFWMLLSGNAEVAFLSTTATTTAATSIPVPAATRSPVPASGANA
jgi:hypothetical protein